MYKQKLETKKKGEIKMLFSTEKLTLLNALEVVTKAINKNTKSILECAIIDVKDGKEIGRASCRERV